MSGYAGEKRQGDVVPRLLCACGRGLRVLTARQRHLHMHRQEPGVVCHMPRCHLENRRSARETHQSPNL